MRVIAVAEEYGDFIKRTMRDRDDDDASQSDVPRCEGCGQRVELAP
jgi:hypothetical protein